MSSIRVDHHRSSARSLGRWRKLAVLGVLGSALLSACAGNHRDQAYLQVFEQPSGGGPVAKGAPPEDTVARGQLREDAVLYTGKGADGKAVKEFPFPVTEEFVRRGGERYQINCVPCHGRVGKGDGMIVRRGFQAPPSFHEQRLRDADVGYLYDIITNGQGAMMPYADQVAPRDRWAIVAYIRALQVSQNATEADVRAAERAQPAEETQDGAEGTGGAEPEEQVHP